MPKSDYLVIRQITTREGKIEFSAPYVVEARDPLEAGEAIAKKFLSSNNKDQAVYLSRPYTGFHKSKAETERIVTMKVVK